MGVDIETYRGRIGTFKHACGVDVLTFTCVVNFNGGIRVIGCVFFIGLLLLMAGIESNPGPINNGTESDKKGEERRKILVAGIPDGVDKEYLHLFFKNQKKQGGGKIDEITFDEENRSAEILFKEPAAVKIVLQKRPVKMMDTVVEIIPAYEDLPRDYSEQSALFSTVRVTGMKVDSSLRERLELYFEDEESSGGGDVTDIKIVEDGTAFVTFESVEVAQRVINRKDHNLQNKVLTIDSCNEEDSMKYLTCYDSSTESMEIRSPQMETEEEKSSTFVSLDDIRIQTDEETPNKKTDVTETSEDDSNETKVKSEESPDKTTGNIQIIEETARNKPDACSMRVDTLNVPETPIKGKDITEETPDKLTVNIHNSQDNAHKVKDNGSMTVQDILQLVGLTDKYPAKIKIRDVNFVDLDMNEENPTNEKLPWVLLAKFTAVQSKSRDLFSPNIPRKEHCKATHGTDIDDIFGLLHIDDNATNSNNVSPFDIFLLTIQCCDPMLKQLLFKKLYLCKFALPFIQRNHLSQNWEVNMWPFRSLILESRGSTPNVVEIELLELPVKTVTFANFGRPSFSKSKLINDMLSDEIQDTFFNMNCPGGMYRRCISNGIVEMFTLTSVCSKRDKFEEAVTFFNMRGNTQKFADNIIELMSKISDTLVLVVDKLHFDSDDEDIVKIISRFSFVCFLVASCIDQKTVEKIKEISNKIHTQVKVISSHRELIHLNSKEMVQQMERVLKKAFELSTAQSLEDRIKAAEYAISIDETLAECKNGKEKAILIMKAIESIESGDKCKKAITPVHYIHSKKLGESFKKLYRLKDVKETRNIEQDIKSIRETQLLCISKPVKLFILYVQDFKDKPECIGYMLRWLSIFLDGHTRKVVPQLVRENQRHREKLEDLRNKAVANTCEIKTQQQKVEHSQERIEDATVGLEHLFRELGHIYEAVCTLHKETNDLEIPSVTCMVKSMAHLVTEGYTFELIDGDNFYCPNVWVRSVLEQVSSQLNDKPILTMSVLGIQSSGKSTLLNSMFGSQFPVKSGRCTRGLHMQILPIISSKSIPFRFVAILDSEGLRASELMKKQNHDNELSTVITGLGDVTLLNIMGENTSEIRDIIQVVVHAFLRLKLVNKSLDIGKSFYLLHQNVLDVTARDKMRIGLNALMETLDSATKDAAETENIKNITTFRQVIEFDLNSNVWYLPNYWQGNPPMARVNSEYSDRLSEYKLKLFEKAYTFRDKSQKALGDVAVQIQDLWKGVLTEDFVFCFRNSLEVKAYIQMEMALKQIMIQFEDEVETDHLNHSQKLFSACCFSDQLQNVTDEVIRRMRDTLTEKEAFAVNGMKEYFVTGEYKDTIMQWKDFAVNRVKLLSSELEDRIKTETRRMRDRTCIDIRIKEGSLQHEKELYERCLQVAREIKGECLNMEDIENKFEETWEQIKNEILDVRILQTVPDSLFDNFLKCLFDIFSNERLILKTELERRGLIKSSKETQCGQEACRMSVPCIEMLKGSFSATGISSDDINFTPQTSGNNSTHNLSNVEVTVEKCFDATTLAIEKCLQDNEEITYREVRRFLLKSFDEIKEIQQQDSEMSFKITALVKLCVHISCYAQMRFEAQNTEYQTSKGIPARLDRYKSQVREQFISYLKDRKAEETAARHITVIVENELWDTMNNRLQRLIKGTLVQHLPTLKFHLILEMMEDMANNDDFESFITYMKNPRKFAKRWMRQKSEEYLFSSKPMKYLELAAVTVDEVYGDIKQSVERTCSALKSDLPSVEKWIETFTANFSKFSIPKSEFRDVVKDLKQIEDMNNFHSNLIEHLTDSLERAKSKFESKGRECVKLKGNDSPFKVLFANVWGCPEQCAYCGEPCAKSFTDHKGVNHYSLQHRISCCSGAREDFTHKAAITSCNFNVQSFQEHHCDLFNYRCNQGKNVPCKQKWHEFRKYKLYLPDWDIEPNANMQDCSMFWMWFVAKYKYQLAIHYNYDVSDIPDAWNDITKEDAFSNLRRIYKSQ